MDTSAPECKTLKDSYDACNVGLFGRVLKQQSVNEFFSCNALFKDYKDCFDIVMTDKIIAAKEKREK